MLPDSPVESEIFLEALGIALSIIGPVREAYRHSKIIISVDNTFAIIRRNTDTGKIQKSRFRVGENGKTYEWIDE